MQLLFNNFLDYLIAIFRAINSLLNSSCLITVLNFDTDGIPMLLGIPWIPFLIRFGQFIEQKRHSKHRDIRDDHNRPAPKPEPTEDKTPEEGVEPLKRPLEQFEVDIFSRIPSFGKLDLRLTYTSIYLMIGCSLIFFIFYWGLRNKKVIGKRWQFLTESFLNFISDLAVQQAGYKAKPFIALYFVIFLFILGLNVIGLVPMGFTVTSHILITLALSFSLNIGLLVIGFWYHGIHFLKLFVPSDAPKPLLPLIVLIEVISYVIRPFSLAIRLFANMMAGHTLLFILSGFVLAFLNSSFFMLGILPLTLVFAVVCLEVGISFLQAYVFTVLFAIYRNDAFNLH